MPSDHPDMLIEELARLREEVVNTRNVSIKADNLIKNLSNEVKGINQRQTQRDRKALINSMTAYILFVALISVGSYFTIEARTNTRKADKTLFERQEATFKREIAELKAELSRWHQIERELLEFERLVRSGNKEQAVAKFSALRRVRFSGLLEDLIVRFRAEVAREKYEQGLEFYKQGSFDKADEAFLKSLEYKEDPPYMGNLLYHQGMCAVRLKDFPRASDILRQALGFKHSDWRTRADAMYHLAYAHDRMGEKRTARDLYYGFYSRFDTHHMASLAKRRYKQLKGP
ncbi:tetratricopeptide repeat protein [Myxococcota bacterium]|nr:tetratricopeptide repeat protein [Myxococcota bacterium]MBU1432741.1 tetratricopeptide repeat protein [Myxococcota bacterium]MBU1898087.1 tetratricopeptide repeat protein [Myxococcota bacterium]